VYFCRSQGRRFFIAFAPPSSLTGRRRAIDVTIDRHGDNNHSIRSRTTTTKTEGGNDDADDGKKKKDFRVVI